MLCMCVPHLLDLGQHGRKPRDRWKYARGVPPLPSVVSQLGPNYTGYAWRRDPDYTASSFQFTNLDRVRRCGGPPPSSAVAQLATQCTTCVCPYASAQSVQAAAPPAEAGAAEDAEATTAWKEWGRETCFYSHN